MAAGAGAAGLNAALEAKEAGLSCLVLEKGKIANTIEDFPEGKWVYAEPDSTPPKGKLWLDGACKEDLIKRWNEIIDENNIDIRTEEEIESADRVPGNLFDVRSSKGTYRAKRIILAIGQRGNPRRLGVPGEDREEVYHSLYSPGLYSGKRIVVVGGGNSAVEAAIVLSRKNTVTLSYRQDAFDRVFRDNRRKLDEAIQAGRIEVIFNSSVTEFMESSCSLEMRGPDSRVEKREIPCDTAFVLIGAELPVRFLRKVGIRLENEWHGSMSGAALLTIATLFFLSIAGPDIRMENIAGAIPGWTGALLAIGTLAALIASGSRGNRYAWLGLSFLICFTVYGAKLGNGAEFWPFRGWGYDRLSFGGRPWSFWYTFLYTMLITLFGLRAMKRWGFDKSDRFQILRFTSLLAFQWVFFFIIPEFLFQWAVNMQWVGEALAGDPAFAGQAWRSYGIVYAWPLFFFTFFYDPHTIWVVWGALLTFLVLPIFVLFHGRRYCSWICGCGGLAETLGDRWRHLAPKGRNGVRWEWMNRFILISAAVVTAAVLSKDLISLIREPAESALNIYRIGVDVWLVGILPVTLYPFLGGKVWCRFWCPLAKLMEYYSKWFGRFHITANEKCIACSECTRYCQVGIDVMNFALKQEDLTNRNSSCIGCGICVTVCPMDTLSFGAVLKKIPAESEPSNRAASRS